MKKKRWLTDLFTIIIIIILLLFWNADSYQVLFTNDKRTTQSSHHQLLWTRYYTWCRYGKTAPPLAHATVIGTITTCRFSGKRWAGHSSASHAWPICRLPPSKLRCYLAPSAVLVPWCDRLHWLQCSQVTTKPDATITKYWLGGCLLVVYIYVCI